MLRLLMKTMLFPRLRRSNTLENLPVVLRLVLQEAKVDVVVG